MQGCFGLCNWLSLRDLRSWINHLPLICRSIFGRSILDKLVGKFDRMEVRYRNGSSPLCKCITSVTIDFCYHLNISVSFIFSSQNMFKLTLYNVPPFSIGTFHTFSTLISHRRHWIILSVSHEAHGFPYFASVILSALNGFMNSSYPYSSKFAILTIVPDRATREIILMDLLRNKLYETTAKHTRNVNRVYYSWVVLQTISQPAKSSWG